MKYLKTYKLFEKIELIFSKKYIPITRIQKTHNLRPHITSEFIDVITDICQSFDLNGTIDELDKGLVDGYMELQDEGEAWEGIDIGGMKWGGLYISVNGDLTQMKSLVVDLENVVKDWVFDILIDIERSANGGWLYDYMTAEQFIELETRFEVSELRIIIYKS